MPTIRRVIFHPYFRVVSWFEGNNEALDLFRRFQPKDVIGKENYQIFNTFQSYTESEMTMIYHRIEKEYKKKPLDFSDYESLTIHQESAFVNSLSKLNAKRGSKNKSIKTRESNFKTSRSNFGHFAEEMSEKEKEKKVGFNLTARVSK